MTELPRYIGRHASPGAAAPSSDDTSPDHDMAVAEPAMPRLDFDPSVAEEPTMLDPSPRFTETDLPDDMAPPSAVDQSRSEPSEPTPIQKWAGPARSEDPPGPGARPPGPAGDRWAAPAPDIAKGPVPVPEDESDADADELTVDAEAGTEEPEPEPEPAESRAGFFSEPDAEDAPEPEESWAPRESLATPRAPQPSAMPLSSPASASPRSFAVPRELDSHGLARLALLDAVQEVWPGGTPDFAAWLASNLELLEDPLGFSLAPRRPVATVQERQVIDGPDADQSPLDIAGNLLTADFGGAPVVVRAQVGEADTDGFGALLSAAAATQAKTAVWVCPRIDQSLRQSLRWVGGDPSANVRLYGLEMYLVQIADSPTAPLFDAVVSPGTP